LHAKLTLILMVTVSLAVLLAAGALVLHDVGIIRAGISRHVSTLAAVFGAQSAAALRSGDAEAARQGLGCRGGGPPSDCACLYDARGRPFVSYGAIHGDSESEPSPPQVGCSPSGTTCLKVYQRVTTNRGEHVGMIYLHADMAEVRGKLW